MMLMLINATYPTNILNNVTYIVGDKGKIKTKMKCKTKIQSSLKFPPVLMMDRLHFQSKRQNSRSFVTWSLKINS